MLSISFSANTAGATGTVTVGNVVFDETVTVNGTPLKLRGAAVLRYLAFFKAYAGALYLPPDASTQSFDKRHPQRLELSYYRDITGEDFDRATRKKVADNVDAATLEALESRLDRLGTVYRDVRPGDRYALTYIPGDGIELSLNGTLLGRFAGSDFAEALYSIWLGQNPIDTDFRDALMGLR